MTENKRFTTDNGSNEDVCLVDNVTGKEFESDFDEIVELLNALHEENQQLKRDMKGYETNYEMFKETPILFVGGVPYVSVGEIHKQAELVVLRENERIKNGEE